MTPDTTVDWANRGAPSVYTNRLELSQAWFDALYGARSQRDVSPAAAGVVRRERAPEHRADDRNGRALENPRATTIARAAMAGNIAMNRPATRAPRLVRRQVRIPAAPAARGCGRVIVLRGNGGLAIAIVYTERGLSIAAQGARPAAAPALERARQALIAQGIVHRTFTFVSQASEPRHD